MNGGQRLKNIRYRLRITTREVQELSRAIATEKRDPEYFISHARIIQIENDESTPSIYKMYSLSVIYAVKLRDILGFYVDLTTLATHQLQTRRSQTHPINFESCAADEQIDFPLQFAPGLCGEGTNLLSRMVDVWGHIPVALLRHLDIKKTQYGFIGFKDFTMHPLLRPGTFVRIDDRQQKVTSGVGQNEFDRPIYFIELRDGYKCSWCEIRENRLFLLPHPLSGCKVQDFPHPSEAEIIGRVTAIATRIVGSPPQTVAESV
jgi:transcriptional regulator with XRE-family HTH domain